MNISISKDIVNKDISIENRGYYIQKKVTENIILNRPKFDIKNILNYKKKLVFIEKSEDNYIPCLFLRNNESSNFLIYFHGNSEDIFGVENNGLYFKSNFNMNIIIVEYPGYSIYFDKSPEPKTIFLDSINVYNWIKNKFNASDEQIFVYGRSLGTSPAIYLSSKMSPKALFLVSAFTSIKDIGSDKFCSWFLEDIFNSIDYIGNVKCPILLIHGEKDSLISITHSEKLEKESKKKNKRVYLNRRPNMTHNKFDIYEDIIDPIKYFIQSHNLNSNMKILNNTLENQNNDIFKIPKSISLKIESEIFNINDFVCTKKIDKKSCFYLIRLIDERIAVTCDSTISIYNDRNYILDYDIDIYKNTNKIHKGIIFYLFQMKNENLVCSTNKGDIFIFEIDLDGYNQLNHILINDNEEIYKIDIFGSKLLCSLSSNYIKLYNDEDFQEKYSFKNLSQYIDFVYIPFRNIYAFLSYKGLFFHEFKEKKIQNYILHLKFTPSNLNHIMILTNTSLYIGGYENIYYYDYIDDKYNQVKFSSNEEFICFLYKIHDQLFLASTSNGNILQIKINENKEPFIISKFFEISREIDINSNIQDKSICSLLLKNLKCILFTDEQNIHVLTIPNKKEKEKEKEKDCIIF